MAGLRKYMPLAAVALLVFWTIANAARLSEADEVFIRAVLGAVFFLLLMLRRKSSKTMLRLPLWLVVACFPAGALLAAIGIVVPLNMVEWLGVLLLVCGALLWGLPPQFRRDILLGCFLLFWTHPLPSQVFNSLQDAMQYLSVQGSEAALHISNVGVWADGIVLRTGYHDFMVPEACSGMRTSVTVLYCVIGVGILLRLRAHTILLFGLLGLLHVLVFNIARISYMVLWAPKMPPEWANTFLHDTLGIFLLGCIVIIQGEMAGWVAWRNRRRRLREGISSGEIERPERASIVPGSIRRLGWIVLVVAVITIPVGSGFLLKHRLRPSHKGEMLRRVVEGLVQTNLARAPFCIEKALGYLPGDRALLVQSCYADVLSGRYLDALDKFDALGIESLGIDQQSMRAWALMRLGRIREARQVLDGLPKAADRWPGVAMLRAEFGAMDKKPQLVAEYVRHAARSYLMVPRIRALLPFLARYEQWETISAVDSPRPYTDPMAALVTVRAHLLVNQYTAASRVLLEALEQWPDNMTFQWAVYEFARRRGGEWTERFAAQAERNIARLDEEELARTAERALLLGRADLAWRVYLWLMQMDDTHPMLTYLPARYATAWFNFPQADLQVRAGNAAVLPVRATLRMLDRVEPFGSLVASIPLYDLLTSPGRTEAREALLPRAAAEFRSRMEAGQLSVLDQFTFVRALSMLQEWKEAHATLDQIALNHPDLRNMVFLQHATLHFEQGDRQSCYESLRAYDEADGAPMLFAEMMRIAAMAGENQAVGAYSHMLHARLLFPGDPRLARAEAVLWLLYGCPEEAYHLLTMRPKEEMRSPVGYESLLRTGRLRQAKQVGDAFGFQSIPADTRQSYRLLPAERLLMLPEQVVEDPAAWAAERRNVARERSEQAVSPFVRDLNALTVAWLDARSGTRAYPARDEWLAVGRDRTEQASSLYRLASLHALVGERPLAAEIMETAVAMEPESLPLWRLYVSCSESRTTAVERARAACPTDPALWVLSQVARIDAGELTAVRKAVRARLAARDVPVEHMVRVADYCRRKGGDYLGIAREVADALVLEDPGLLPLLVLGIETGVATGDLELAMRCVRHAIENAFDPFPFFKILVELKAAAGQVDTDLIAALNRLTEKEPGQIVWSEQLGLIYFHSGRMRQALAAFRSVFDRDAAQANQTSMLLAAEAARQENRYAEALQLLELAYGRDPARLATVNNLVYLLAQRRETLARARTLLPNLEERAGENAAVLDTIAFVYRQLGELEKAAAYSSRALSLVREGSYEKGEVLLNAARIRLAAGEVEAARGLLEQVRATDRLPVSVDVEARRLMDTMGDLPE